MVTKFQIEAMTRADMPEKDRRDFGLYVDEFQNFATDSFATILSEARKYKLSLTMANQYIAQMADTVQGAVFGNVGTIISFQVGQQDATVLSEMFGGEDIILPNDLTNLRKYDIYSKLLIDGMPSPVFSATTFAPLMSRVDVPEQQSRDVVLKVSREKYTKKREFVEKKIFEYAGKVREEEIKAKSCRKCRKSEGTQGGRKSQKNGRAPQSERHHAIFTAKPCQYQCTTKPCQYQCTTKPYQRTKFAKYITKRAKFSTKKFSKSQKQQKTQASEKTKTYRIKLREIRIFS